MKFIDLFCGIGGFRIALESLGAECVFSSEIDKWARRTYEENFHETPHGNIRTFSPEEIPDHDILCAGFPCQPFSIASVEKKGFSDTRGTLFFEIEKILAVKKPQAFLLENVKNLLYHENGRTMNVILRTLSTKLGYTVFYKILNSKDYVPQKRERIFIVGFRNEVNGFTISTPLKNNKKLRDILEADVPIKYYLSQKGVDGMNNHKANHPNDGLGYQLNNLDGEAFTLMASRFGRKNNLIIDRRISEAERILHNKNSDCIRRFTPRELARLQGFPETFVITEADEHCYTQFGNSVTVPVVRTVAEGIMKTLKESENMK